MYVLSSILKYFTITVKIHIFVKIKLLTKRMVYVRPRRLTGYLPIDNYRYFYKLTIGILKLKQIDFQTFIERK